MPPAPPTPSREDAQRRADTIRAFQDELRRLEDGGVITLSEDQRTAIAKHHAQLLAEYQAAFDVDRTTEAKQLSLGMRVASFCGALALSASVYFLFHQFWGALSTPTQVVILAGSPAVLLTLTLAIRARDASGYFAALAASAAFACFVLDLSMLGQIFNIAPSYFVFAAWSAFALLLAHACDARVPLAAGLVCAILFVSAAMTALTGAYWTDFPGRFENFFPGAAAVFIAPVLLRPGRHPGFPVVCRVIGLLTFFVSVLIASHWGRGSYIPASEDTVEAIYQLIGFGAAAGAVALGARRGWPDTVNVGLTFFVVFLYWKFVDWWWDSMPKSLFFLLLALIAILILVVLRRVRTSVLATAGNRTVAV